jgi:lipopolysaccharide transport system ATP-binding protein
MSDSVISVENLSKRYIIGHQRNRHDGLRHRIEAAARAPWRWFHQRLSSGFRSPGSDVRTKTSDLRPLASELSRATREEFWALKDVSFEVREGDVLGVIGRNGAGKSTLLKVLSRITEPTQGRVRIKGRVASLLEVGTGFHPELTGRENVFLNGAILGMSKAEITRKFDEIVAFSEIEKFLDTPVKRYSSGTYVRLAFAVAAHLEPEILIVDEVLAVGDAQFQKKCLGKMGEVSRGGHTVLFVSHNMVAVQSLCHRAVLLQEGKLLEEGQASAVVSRYLSVAQRHHEVREWRTPKDAPGTDTLRVRGVRIRPEREEDTGLQTARWRTGRFDSARTSRLMSCQPTWIYCLVEDDPLGPSTWRAKCT